MTTPYRDHLRSSRDLETTYEAVRAGFVALALEKNRRATPHVAQARALKASASQAKTPGDLVRIKDIQPALLTAAGVSDKAANHLEESDKGEAISRLIEKFLEPAGANFIEELVFRFLLTRGDALGGSMRNVGGFLAQCKLIRAVIAHLSLAGKAYRWLPSDAKEWIGMPDDDADIELHLRGLAWESDGRPRTLVFNLTVPCVKNNVDLCLLDAAPENLSKETQANPELYLALGELKGGIDPAGADEHWKTAHSALDRIRTAFGKQKLNPDIFFVGAAIETRMAAEMWKMLKKGTLENAANLTDDRQIASIT